MGRSLHPPRQPPVTPASKECPACLVWKPFTEFLKISKNADGLAHKCKVSEWTHRRMLVQALEAGGPRAGQPRLLT